MRWWHGSPMLTYLSQCSNRAHSEINSKPRKRLGLTRTASRRSPMVSLPVVTLVITAPTHSRPRPERARRGLFLRIVYAISESNRRKAEREIARFIARKGGRIADSLEREVER